jgi:hypothetical protein
VRVLPGQFAAEVERSRAVVARAQALLLDRTYKRDKEGQFAATTGGKDVREALAGHETAEAVGTAAAAEAKRITGRDIDFDLAGSDPQIAAEHAEGILRGLERFPTTGLKAVRHGTDPEAEQREVFAVTSRDGGTITFTANAQKYGAAGYRAELKQARAEHAISAATATPIGVALHEFGHSVANSHGANDPALNAGYRHAEGKKAGVSTTIQTDLGRYATSADREMVAEGFAQSMVKGDKASGTAKAIMAGMEEFISSGQRGHVGG